MKILLKNKHWKLDKDYDTNKILYLLIDRPNHINSLDDFCWKLHIKDHRDYDLPAVMYSNGVMAWFKNDFHHRNINKPAIIWSDGLKEYYINNKFIKDE